MDTLKLKTNKNVFDTAFSLNRFDLAATKGNIVAACKIGIN